jgi:hypothetical protein
MNGPYVYSMDKGFFIPKPGIPVQSIFCTALPMTSPPPALRSQSASIADVAARPQILRKLFSTHERQLNRAIRMPC